MTVLFFFNPQSEIRNPQSNCWITNSIRSVNSTVIQYPGTKIQNRTLIAAVFFTAAKNDSKILCNYWVNPAADLTD